MLLRNLKAPDGVFIDLLVEDGKIVAVGLVGTLASEGEEIDCGGRVVFPGFVDAHAHMDKTLLGLGWYRNEVGPALQDMFDNERNLRLARNIDFHEQSARAGRRMIAAGTTHTRTFVDIDTGIGLAAFEGLLHTREELADGLSIQIVAFPQSGMLVRPGTVELLEEALKQGAEVIGGLDPSAVDRDPKGHLDTIFGLAEKYDRDVDIHLHEPGELGAFDMEEIAERTKRLGFQGRVVISHAFCLGSVDEATLGHLIELLVENDIAIMSHAPSGPRVSPSVKRLREAGVRMCTGNDGIRDAWGPLNMPDMLLRAFLLVYRNNFRRDDDIQLALDIATSGGAQVIGVENYGLEPGNAADLVVVDGENQFEALFERPARWLVMKDGKVVAREGECLV
ncbi:MAG TPA: amidohydrolase family protein [Thermomicrobiales bacterium]|nr:amidohydrolase family protein [Thermomicrobiales bacterium]